MSTKRDTPSRKTVIGEDQTAGCRLVSLSLLTRSSQTAGWFLPPLTSTDKTLFPINKRLYSTADGRSEPFIYCPLHVQWSIRDCGEVALHAHRFPLPYSEWSDQMRLPLELWCFFIRIMPHAERVRETEEVKNAGFAAHAGSSAVQSYFIAFSSSKWLH